MAEVARAFDEFVVARGPALLRSAYLLTHDTGLAEDLVQDALVRAHRRWDRHPRAEQPEAYVRRIMVNEFVSWRRRKSSGEVPGPVPEVAQSDFVGVLAERDLVWRVLAELPRRQRAVLILRYYEGLNDHEIAPLVGCADRTVRSLAARAFQRLRREQAFAERSNSTTTSAEERR